MIIMGIMGHICLYSMNFHGVGPHEATGKMCIVAEGLFDTLALRPDGSLVPVSQQGPGAVFGWAALAAQPSKALVRARSRGVA